MTRTILATACAWLMIGSDLRAQFTTPPLTVPFTPACTAPPEPHTLWSFLGLSHHNIKKCRTSFCRSRLGRMCDSMATPLRLASGGLVPRFCCDVPSREELACMSPDSCSLAEMVAAKIKRDEADACTRRSAVRFLGTVDCHYYHEAEEALIAHLRADQNECVRLEAAQVLARGCCCTSRIIEALKIVVTGTAEDGNPPEKSERVKAAAMHALQSCLASFHDMLPESPLQTPPLEVLPPPTPKLPIQLMAHTESVAEKSPTRPDPLLEAQRTFAAKVGAPSASDERAAARPSRNLLQIVSQATTLPEMEPPAPRQATPTPRNESRIRPIGLAPIGGMAAP